MRGMSLAAEIMLIAALAGCNADFSGASEDDSAASGKAGTKQSSPENVADAMASRDPGPGEQAAVRVPDSQDRPVMQTQVVLDRLGFMPGVIDGSMRASTRNAIEGFQQANGLEITGLLDQPTVQRLARWDNIAATRVVTIPDSFAQETFTEIPDRPAAQAKMKRLGYTSLDEKLAERFHTTAEVLKSLNPDGRPASPDNLGIRAEGASAREPGAAATSRATASTGPAETSVFRAGQIIRVPNIGADKIVPGMIEDADWAATLRSLGVGSEQPRVSKIVVSKSAGTLKGYDEGGKLVVMATATMGSEHDPLPLGGWKILGVAHDPPFSYDPDLFWDVPDDAGTHRLPPGPNGPVGVVWIDLSKEHYGIHGTPDPETIGRVESHGCIRLTNWDAARLAEMVSPGTKAIFEQ